MYRGLRKGLFFCLFILTIIFLSWVFNLSIGIVLAFLLLFVIGTLYCAYVARTFAERVWYIVASIASAGFFGVPLLQAYQSPWLGQIEFPNAQVESWAVDREYIYLTSTALGRVQIYDLNGRFQKAWIVSNFGRPVSIEVMHNDRIGVCNVSNELMIFTRDGRRLDIDGGKCVRQISQSMQDNPIINSFGYTEVKLKNGHEVKIWNPASLFVLWSPFVSGVVMFLSFLFAGLARLRSDIGT